MGRFASTVPFYERTRQPYGSAFFAHVARTLRFDRGQRLLDLGTGPGLLALGFAPYVGEVVGVDPEPAMLAAARQNAERAGIALRLIDGTTETLPDDIGRFGIVTIGRALHWMDPERTRAALNRVVERNGVVLVCSSVSVADGRNPWLADYDALRRSWSDEAGVVRRREHDAFFAGTRFRSDETLRVEARQVVTIDELTDRIFSMSSSSIERVGGEAEAVRSAARAVLTPFAKGDAIAEIVEAKAEVFRCDRGSTPPPP